jgi:hypothetical protein
VPEGEVVVTEHFKFLLENCDLYQCQKDHPKLCEQLFDMLEQVCVCQTNLKWLFQLHRKSTKKPSVKYSQYDGLQQLKRSASAVRCFDERLIQNEYLDPPVRFIDDELPRDKHRDGKRNRTKGKFFDQLPRQDGIIPLEIWVKTRSVDYVLEEDYKIGTDFNVGIYYTSETNWYETKLILKGTRRDTHEAFDYISKYITAARIGSRANF